VTSTFLPHPVEKSVYQLLEDLSTPRSLAVSILLAAGEYAQLASLRVEPRHYDDAHRYWLDCQATELLRKLDCLPNLSPSDRARVAYEGFWACERACLSSNIRLAPHLDQSFTTLVQGRAHTILMRARKTVCRILGPLPTLVEGRFGPGSTFGDRGSLITVPDKMSSSPTYTSNAWSWLVPWTGTLWASNVCFVGRSPERVRGNRFTTVPKDSMKDRGIAVEPSINLFFQLGLGRVMKQRLLTAGVNLAQGKSIHTALARKASLDGSLSTLDLSNASDTICRNLVEILLPRDWFAALSELRSPFTLVDGKWVFLDKFSSMGNGFTFELETIIFLSLAAACGGEIGRDVFSYGDDIICPSHIAKEVIAILTYCGLTVNERKSFVDGPFRESCGGDFFLCADVRPHYLKKSPCEPQEVISLMNGLRRSCSHNMVARWPAVHGAWRTLLDSLPIHLRRCRGPEFLGDIVIHDHQGFWSTRQRNSIRYVRAYAPEPFLPVRLSGFSDVCVLALSTYAPSPRHLADNARIAMRGVVGGYRVVWVPAS